MLGKSRQLYTGPKVAEYLGVSINWVWRWSKAWPNVGVEVGAYRYYDRWDVHRILWLSLNRTYVGPPPWGEEPIKRHPLYTMDEVAAKCGVTRSAIIRHAVRHKEAIGIHVGGAYIFTKRCVARIKEIQATHGQGLYKWDGAVYEIDYNMKLFTLDPTVLAEYDTFAEQHKGVYWMKPEPEEKDRSKNRRNMMGIYLPDEIIEWVEKQAAKEYKSKSDIGLEAILMLKASKGD